jgi:ADP-heptose:LPS heptosyltransferase
MKTIERTLPNSRPKACVVRYGAYGDALWCSPVFEKLKADGYYVIFNCNNRCYDIQRHNESIDCFWLQEDEEIANKDLGTYWKELEAKVDRFINLSGSIEGNLLKTPDKPDYNQPKDIRHGYCNRNYQDETMKWAGYPEATGLLPYIQFTEKEEKWAQDFRARHTGFLVVYSLTGSSRHKTYPYADAAIQAILAGLPDAAVVCVGEAGVKNIIEPHPRLLDLCGDIGIRKAMALTKVADLVISPETAIANAASCYETPKIVLLSHSSVENLTKYWKNCHNIVPPVACYPCHQLHYDKNSCPIEDQTQFPVCVALLHPTLILEKVEIVYDNWKQKQLIRI